MTAKNDYHTLYLRCYHRSLHVTELHAVPAFILVSGLRYRNQLLARAQQAHTIHA